MHLIPTHVSYFLSRATDKINFKPLRDEDLIM